MPQYKYPVKNGIKWMAKFNYTDSKSGKAKTEYKRGFASKREAKKYEEDFIENLIMPEETEIEPIRTFGEVFQEYLMSHKRADIKESTLETKFNIFNKHIFPTFEEKQVDTITDDDIANWQNEIKSVVQPNGKHFSESYLRTIQSQFNSIINYALNKGYIRLRTSVLISCPSYSIIFLSDISTRYLYAVPLAIPTASAIFVVDGDCLYCR